MSAITEMNKVRSKLGPRFTIPLWKWRPLPGFEAWLAAKNSGKPTAQTAQIC